MSEPIIILGAPRSGTTLLAGLLGAHPGCVRAREARLVWRFGNDGLSDELRPEHATGEVIDHVHASFGSLLAGSPGCRLVEKTPSNSLRPQFVDAIFPDARYIHITRDGWACVPSICRFWEQRGSGLDSKQLRKMRRRLAEARPSQVPRYSRELFGRILRPGSAADTFLYGPRVAGLGQVVAERGRLEAAALQWRTCVDQVSAFGGEIGPDRYLEVRLEDLSSDIVGEVLRFAGLPPSSPVAELFEASFDRSLARAKSALDPADRARVRPYVESANFRLGYAV